MKKSCLKKQKGFTYSELLIILVLLGVISSFTIPVVMNRANENSFQTALLKAYKTLGEAYNMVYEVSGNMSNKYTYATEANIEDFYNKIAKHLNIMKSCGHNNTSLTGDCFKQAQGGSNGIAPGFQSNALTKKNAVFILEDGTSVGITPLEEGETVESYGINSADRLDSEYYVTRVDINGAKGPNKVGKDVFAFVYTVDGGLLPAGADNNSANCGSEEASYNYDCTAKVLNLLNQ